MVLVVVGFKILIDLSVVVVVVVCVCVCVCFNLARLGRSQNECRRNVGWKFLRRRSGCRGTSMNLRDNVFFSVYS